MRSRGLLHSLSHLAIDTAKPSASHCSHFDPGTGTLRYPMYMNLDGSQRKTGHLAAEKNLLPQPRNKPRTVQPTAQPLY